MRLPKGICGLAMLTLGAGASLANEIPIYIFAGQSNAVGASTSVDELPPGSVYRQPQPSVLFYGPTEETGTKSWNALVAPTTTSRAITGGPGTSGFGPEISAGRAISLNLLGGATVGEVQFAANSTGLYSEWNPAVPGSLTDLMIARVNTAIAELPSGTTGKVAGFFWMQGENDTGNAATAGAYADNLKLLISKVRTSFSAPNLPVVVGQINNAQTFTPTVRAAQFQVAREVANVRVATTDDLERSPYPGDLIHFSSNGTVQLGERFAETYGDIVSNAPSLPNRGGLITNGSFEDQDLYPWPVVPTNASNPTDLSVTNYEGATDGIHAVAFGRAGGGAAGSISQSFATTSGQQYTLSFDYGNFGPTDGSSVGLFVDLAATDLAPINITDTTGSGYAADASVFNHYAYTFTALGTLATLTFTDTSTNANAADGILDNIMITAVPEPSAATFVTSACVLAATRRRFVRQSIFTGHIAPPVKILRLRHARLRGSVW